MRTGVKKDAQSSNEQKGIPGLAKPFARTENRMGSAVRFFQDPDISLNGMLMGKDFLDAVTEFYNLNYSQMVFTDFCG